MIQPTFEILNQRGTPMFFSDVFANRPTAGIVGRIFISTDTKEFYRDTGTTWELIGGAGAGTITGSGTATQVAFFNGSSTITSDTGLYWDNTNKYFGVGTSSPTNKFEVRGGNIALQSGNKLILNLLSGLNNYLQSPAVANPRLGIFTADIERLSIDYTNGFVGINTINPSRNLDVVGTVLFQGSVTGTGNLSNYSVTASSGLARSKAITSTLIAAANNDVLVGLDINPTFTNGSFTGVTNIGVRTPSIAITGLTSGSVLFAGTSGVLSQNNSTFFWDNTNSRLGIGTNAPGIKLDIFGADDIGIRYTNTNATLTSRIYAVGGTAVGGIQQYGQSHATKANQTTFFSPGNLILQTVGGEGVVMFGTSRNVLIQNGGTFTDTGNRLQVTGTGYFSDSVGIGSTSLTGSSLRIDKNLTGATTVYGIRQGGVIQSDVTSNAVFYATEGQTQAASFTLSNLYYFQASQGALGAGSSITNQYGFFVLSNLTGATNNYGFYGNIAAGTNRWNLYMNGTANNYMNGNLQLGSATAFSTADKLQVTGTSYFLDTRTYSSGAIQSATIDRRLTINSGATISTLTTLSAALIGGTTNFGGSVTIPNSTTLNANLVSSLINFNGAGTITMTQATGIRAASSNQILSYFGGTNSSTLTHYAAQSIYGFYNNNTGSITPVITNAYMLLINDMNEYAHTFTFTNRWGIYQAGANDPNYFAGNILINSTTNTGQKLYVNGSVRIDGQTATTAGGSAGLHLILNLDGTNYKIALLNV